MIKPKLKREKDKSEINKSKKLNLTAKRHSSKNRLYNLIKDSLNKKNKINNLKQENTKNEILEKGTINSYNLKKIQSSMIYPEVKFNLNLNDDINIKKELNLDYYTITQSNITKKRNFKKEYLKNKRNELR